MASKKVNEPCHCGSGRKYKKCCMRRETKGFDERDLIDPGPVPQHVKDATDRMMVEEGYTAEKSATLLRIEQSRRRRARARPVRAMAAWAMLHGLTQGV